MTIKGWEQGGYPSLRDIRYWGSKDSTRLPLLIAYIYKGKERTGQQLLALVIAGQPGETPLGQWGLGGRIVELVEESGHADSGHSQLTLNKEVAR